MRPARPRPSPHTAPSIAAKSDLERQESKAKTGVFIGSYATNPANGQRIPIFIADYVLAGYGTGAIMAVPGHDQRDWEFAHEFGLPIVEVIAGGDISQAAYTGDGEVVNSDYLNGLSVASAKEAITARLAADGRGQARIEYKLRDWLFARQRYWGEPFPIVYDADGRPHPLPESALPVELPDVADYSPVLFDPDDADSEPSPPLAKATDWVHVELDLGDGLKPYTRDTNVMPQWAGSSWYELRYADPHNSEEFCAKENEAYWMGPRPAEHGADDPGGVDLYVGGVEHAVLHLLYSRFWHKVLYDLGHVSSREPYRRLVNQGYIQAFAYTDSRGVLRARRRGRRARRKVLLLGPGRRDRGLPGVRQDRQEPEELGVTRRDLRQLRRRHPARVRDVDGSAGGVAAVGDQGRRRRAPVPAAGVAAGGRRAHRRGAGGRPRGARRPTRCGCCTAPSPACPKTMRRCATTPRRPS